MLDPLTQALALAKQHIPVFPVSENKHPKSPHGFKDASADTETIKRLWARYPAPLVGIATGVDSGLDALDIDPRGGGEDWLLANQDSLPATRCHKTRSGGWHFLFKHHEGLRNSTSRVAAGVDVRADGGCLIWWPAAGFPVLSFAEPAPWPEWLLKLALPPPRPDYQAIAANALPVGQGYAAAALRHATQAVATAPEGQRNATLNREAFGLMRFAQAGVLQAPQIAEHLARAALSAGLSRNEITQTLASALRARGIA